MATKFQWQQKFEWQQNFKWQQKFQWQQNDQKDPKCTKFNPRGLASYVVWACYIGVVSE